MIIASLQGEDRENIWIQAILKRNSRYSSLPWREGKREGDCCKTSPSPNLSLLRERE